MRQFGKITSGIVMATLAVTMLGGCKKFLDRKPLLATIDDLQGGDLEGRVLGLYGAVRNSAVEPYAGDGFQSIPYIAMNGFRSDDAEIVADPGASAWHQTYDNFQYTKDDWGAGLYWSKHYALIGIANEALDAVEQTTPTATTKVFESEAKFFRAYSYFDLVRTFGDVPKIDFKIEKAADAQVAKSNADAIYDFIESDLTFATQNLPISWDASYSGRLTSGAAKTFLAKVKLYRKKWAEALSLSKEVINSNQYELVKPYYSIFKTSGELNKESIFEIQAAKTGGDANIYWSRYGQTQGVRGSGTWDLGWGWNTPTQALVDAYETGDQRKEATILESGKFDGGPNTGGYGLTLPNLSNAKYWNKKVYNRYEDYLAAGLGTPNNEAQNTWVNQRVFRYADVLLMAAEAANEVGGASNITDALTWVNMIRDRAGLAAITTTPTQAALRAIIKKERRVEFGMENERFFDLVRWGDANAVLGPLGYQNKHRYFPIPGAALSDNPKLTQNPEW
jgi:starch-binding outer membrane protein, SusD/RagB family